MEKNVTWTALKSYFNETNRVVRENVNRIVTPKGIKALAAIGVLGAALGQGMPSGFAGEEQHAADHKGVATLTAAPAAKEAPSIVLPPTALPGPIAKRGPKTVEINLQAIEVTAKIDNGGSTFNYWTFNGTVPGPFERVREGDTVHVTFTNAKDSKLMHNVDFHAVTGPGGGAVATSTMPGETKGFSFKALNPGVYVYHCATPPVAQHISRGMYGLILVEPKEGLPKVDHEFYVMQGEIHTQQPQAGAKGPLNEDFQKLMDEMPTHYVFNGASGALIDKPLKAKVGETVRIYFGVGGPNKISSFHVIGEIFDKVAPEGSLKAAPLTNVQTTLVAPGGATMVEMKLEAPGKYMLVDHALSRAMKGGVGVLDVEGPENPAVFKADQPVAPPSMKH